MFIEPELEFVSPTCERRLLTKSFGLEVLDNAAGVSSKSCGLDIEAISGFWTQIF